MGAGALAGSINFHYFTPDGRRVLPSSVRQKSVLIGLIRGPLNKNLVVYASRGPLKYY